MKRISVMTMALMLSVMGIFAATGTAGAYMGEYHGGMGHQGGMMANVTPEARANMDKAYAVMAPLSKALYEKQMELNTQITAGANPDAILSLTREVNDLSAKLNEAQVAMRQQMVRDGVTGGGNGYGRSCCLAPN